MKRIVPTFALPRTTMRKSFNRYLALCAALSAVLLSCNNNKSYADMLKAEKKAIDRFIAENEIEILKSYPANGVFEDRQFVALDNGVYLNVVDSGNGNRAVSGKTTVMCRARVKWLMEWLGADTATVDNLGTASSPMVFRYGVAVESYDEFSTYFFNSALAAGLEYVGDSSTVKMIVPFSMSSQTFNTNGIPLYYSKVLYRFDPK